MNMQPLILLVMSMVLLTIGVMQALAWKNRDPADKRRMWSTWYQATTFVDGTFFLIGGVCVLVVAFVSLVRLP